MHISTKSAIARALSVSGLLSIAEQLPRSAGHVIFNLHRVLPTEELGDCYNPHLVISPEAFAGFLRFAHDSFQVVPLPGLLTERARGAGKKPLCAITFDDGWEDNHRFAFPLLRQKQTPATIFLCTGLVGTDRMLPEERLWRIEQAAIAGGMQERLLARVAAELASLPSMPLKIPGLQGTFKNLPMARKLAFLDELEAEFGSLRPKRPGFLTWEQVREMQAGGVTFGSHTVRHAILIVEDTATIRQELVDSLQTLQQQAPGSPKLLAYPNGSVDERVASIALEAGYEAAVSTRPGSVKESDASFRIPRHLVENVLTNDGGGRFSPERTRLHIVSNNWLY